MLEFLVFVVLLLVSWPLALLALVAYGLFCGLGLALKTAGFVAGVALQLVLGIVLLAGVAAVGLVCLPWLLF